MLEKADWKTSFCPEKLRSECQSWIDMAIRWLKNL